MRIGSLLAGQADYIRYVQAFDEAQVDRRRLRAVRPADPRREQRRSSLRFTNPLLSDIRVRQALVAGVDAQEVVDTIFTENYPRRDLGAQLAPPSATRTSRSTTPTTPTKSAELLDEAGWADGADGIREKDGERLSLDVYEAKPQPLSKQTLELVAPAARRRSASS